MILSNTYFYLIFVNLIDSTLKEGKMDFIGDGRYKEMC